MRRFYLIISMLLVALFLFGQNTSDQSNYNVDVPPIPYLSPEAASLGRYGEIPVSEYTGVPDISIPLYTIKSGELEMPISLSYHASGIKVTQEATWVGLGWDLMAGGCITRVVSGTNDELYHSSLPRDHINGLLHEAEEQGNNLPYWTFGEYHWGIYNPGSIYSPDLFNYLVGRKIEPDIFRASFCGHTVNLYIDPETQLPKIVGKVDNNYKIVVNGINTANWSWEITDNQGIKYLFERDAQEKTYINESGNQGISTWGLTQIIHPQKGSIRFNFEETVSTVRPIPSVFELKRECTIGEKIIDCYKHYLSPIEEQHIEDNPPYNYLNPEPVISKTEAYIFKRYLQSINTECERMDFFLSDRLDMAGTTKKIDSIYIKSTIDPRANPIKVIFNYSYFQGTSEATECPYYKFFTVGDFKKLRLKLDAVTIGEKVYSFSYNNSTVPSKTSYSQDFWGYYNGEHNSSFLCTPNLKEIIDNGSARKIGTANRYVDASRMQFAMLTKITYPTNGYTLFTYEPNSFLCREWYPLAHDTKPRYSTNSETYSVDCNQMTSPIVRQAFSINENTTLDIVMSGASHGSEASLGGTIGKLYKVSQDTIEIRRFVIPENPESNRVDYSVNDTVLGIGNYLLYIDGTHIRYQDDFDDETHISLSAYIARDSTTYYDTYKGQSYGGGLRIKSIMNYDDNDSLIQSTQYSYTDSSGITTGILMLPIPQIKKDSIYIKGLSALGQSEEYWLRKWTTYTLSSHESVPSITSVNSVPVGYSLVTKTINNRVTKTHFYNRAPELYAHYDSNRFYMTYMNGKILKQSVIDKKSNSIMREKAYDYITLVDDYKQINAYAKDRTLGVIGNEVGFNGFDRYNIYVYPFMTQRIAPSIEIIKTKQGGCFVNDTIWYQYNSEYLMSSITKSTRIQRDRHQLEIKYPSDISSSLVADSMICRNMLDYPIETSIYCNGQIIEHSKNNYALCYGKPVLVEKLWASGTNDYHPRLLLTYDEHGNIVQAIKNNGSPVTFLWGYNNTLPVARIEGVSYGQVSSCVGSILLTYLNGSNPEYYINEIKRRLSGYKNMCSWYKFVPLVGLSSEHLPNGNYTNYEYDMYGRLKRILDRNNSVKSSFDYNYAR